MEEIGFKLYLLYIASWFLHLTSRFKILGSIRFDLLLFAILLILFFISLSNSDKEKLPDCNVGKYVNIIVGYSIISIPLVVWPGSVISYGLEQFIKGVLFYYFTVAFVIDKKKLKIFLFVFIACQTFRCLEPLYLHITEGYYGGQAYMAGEFLNRLSGAPHDIVNPNGLAYIVVTAFTFIYFLSFTSFYYKFFFLTIPLLIYTLVLTGSRSGMICLLVVSASIFYKSKKKLFVAIVGIIVAGIILAHLGADLLDRYKSVYDSSAKNASTSQGRIDNVVGAFKVAFNAPLFGHGLGTSFEASFNFGNTTVMAHNLYAQLAQELGFIGLLIFLLFMKTFISQYSHSYKFFKQNMDDNKTLISISDALHAWIFMNIVFSFASYGLSGYTWYLIAGLSVVLSRIAYQNKNNIPSHS